MKKSSIPKNSPNFTTCKYQVEAATNGSPLRPPVPETILADTAICIHPEDERYTHLHGKRAIVPIAGRSIPIIQDEYVDREFGTGCLKVTPAHDPNDHELGQKHNLEVIDMLNPNGTVNAVGGSYEGQDRFEARKTFTAALDAAGHLVKVEEHPNKVGRSERTGAIIEPRLSMQWFVAMEELAKPALDRGDGRHHPIPPCQIQKQLPELDGERQGLVHLSPALVGTPHPCLVLRRRTHICRGQICGRCRRRNSSATGHSSRWPDNHPLDLRQDEDVLDTWFSSWLWPISVFDGFYSKEEVDYYYPTNDLVTAPEIMFFWVARMIIAGMNTARHPPSKTSTTRAL